MSGSGLLRKSCRFHPSVRTPTITGTARYKAHGFSDTTELAATRSFTRTPEFKRIGNHLPIICV